MFMNVKQYDSYQLTFRYNNCKWQVVKNFKIKNCQDEQDCMIFSQVIIFFSNLTIRFNSTFLIRQTIFNTLNQYILSVYVFSATVTGVGPKLSTVLRLAGDSTTLFDSAGH